MPMPDGTLRIVSVDYDTFLSMRSMVQRYLIATINEVDFNDFLACANLLAQVGSQVTHQPPTTVNTPPWTNAA